MSKEDEILLRMKPGCICKGVKLHVIMQAIADGASSYEKIVKMTGRGSGSSESKRCAGKVEKLIVDLEPDCPSKLETWKILSTAANINRFPPYF